MIRVLFVCLGNICRSPMAEGVFGKLVEQAGLQNKITTDSAGTSGWHNGSPPDGRGQATMLATGIDISGQQSRQTQASDFTDFDYIMAMDRQNLNDLRDACPTELQDKIVLMLDFAPDQPVRQVPDPYYGTDDGFQKVLTLLNQSAKGLLDHICVTNLAD